MFETRELAAIREVSECRGDRFSRECACPECGDIGYALRHLDLTPLGRYLGPRQKSVSEQITEAMRDAAFRVRPPITFNRIRPLTTDDGASSIWDYYGNPPPTPEPQSPQDKVLDDFIAKRKAKRERSYEFIGADDAKEVERRRREIEDGKSLGRALSKAYVHHSDKTERLMPFKVVL